MHRDLGLDVELSDPAETECLLKDVFLRVSVPELTKEAGGGELSLVNRVDANEPELFELARLLRV